MEKMRIAGLSCLRTAEEDELEPVVGVYITYMQNENGILKIPGRASSRNLLHVAQNACSTLMEECV